MNNKSILISGAGIAGPTLAFWLNAAGFEPTIIERAPALRSGGYVIDFWGLGYDIAERMGLAGEINRLGYHMREMRVVDDLGRRITGFGTKVFDELTGGRYVTLGRSDLSRLLFEKVKGTTEVIFNDEIIGLEEQSDSVRVRFKHARERRFDLVIGADGLHSDVRRLAFGPQDRFERQLGMQSQPSRSVVTVRAMRMCICSMGCLGGCLADLRCAMTARYSCLSLPTTEVHCLRAWTRRRRCCGRDIAMADGNVQASWTGLTRHRSFISIASPKSGWNVGRKAASPLLAMRHSAFRFWRDKARPWQ